MTAGDRPTLDTRDRVSLAVAAALDTKAVDLRIRHLAPVT